MAWYNFNFFSYLFHVFVSVVHIHLRVKKTEFYNICGLKDFIVNEKNDVEQSSVLVNAIVFREIFYLKFVSNCSSTHSLSNELSLYYMKHYIWTLYVRVEQKDLLCLRGFQRQRRQGANRKEGIGHLFGLANWKFLVSIIALRDLKEKVEKDYD